MADRYEQVSVRLTNDKVQFTGVSESNPDQPIIFDFAPPLGDGKGYNGLELLLMSLSGCIATGVVYLLRDMGRKISGLEVKAKGLRRNQPPLKFENISLEFIIKSEDTGGADIQKAFALAEKAYCPVWQMIKNNVEISLSYKIESPV